MSARDDLRDFQTQERAKRNGGVRTALDAAATVLGLGDDRIERVWRPDASGDSPLTAELASDRRLRWERQADMLKPRELAFPALAIGLGPKKPLIGAQAQDVYRTLVGACETLETLDALDEAREWVDSFLGICQVLEVTAADDAVRRFVLLGEFRRRPHPERPTEEWTPAVLVDPVYRYIRRADLGIYVRSAFVRISYAALGGRMGEIGWERHDEQMWTPDVPRREAEHLLIRTYRRRGGMS